MFPTRTTSSWATRSFPAVRPRSGPDPRVKSGARGGREDIEHPRKVAEYNVPDRAATNAGRGRRASGTTKAASVRSTSAASSRRPHGARPRDRLGVDRRPMASAPTADGMGRPAAQGIPMVDINSGSGWRSSRRRRDHDCKDAQAHRRTDENGPTAFASVSVPVRRAGASFGAGCQK